MNRSTRLLSSSFSSRLYKSPPSSFPGRHRCPPFATRLSLLCQPFSLRSRPLSSLPRRRQCQLPPLTMEPAGSDAAVADDFVHVPEPVISSVYDGEDGNPTTDPTPSSAQSAEGSSGPVEVRDAAEVHEAPTEHGGGASEGVGGGGGGSGADEDGRRGGVLPEDLSKSVVHLECESSEGGMCDVYLVGTAHVSQESCREVQAVINYLKPQVVFLELCASRIAILQPPQSLQHVPTVREMIDMLKNKNMNALGVLYSWFLAKIANQLEILPGSEFRVAFEEAMSYGAKVILGDRPVQITLRRTWGKMSMWYKTKFIYYMLFQAVFIPSSEDLNKMLKEFDDVDMVTLLVQEMSKEFPSLMETLVYERDLYMSSKLFQVASNHSSVVAVVGKGHLSGIKQHWKKPTEIEHILEIPPSSGISTMKMLASLSLVATGAIVSCIYLFRKR